jgi:hypothetical protein
MLAFKGTQFKHLCNFVNTHSSIQQSNFVNEQKSISYIATQRNEQKSISYIATQRNSGSLRSLCGRLLSFSHVSIPEGLQGNSDESVLQDEQTKVSSRRVRRPNSLFPLDKWFM